MSGIDESPNYRRAQIEKREKTQKLLVPEDILLIRRCICGQLFAVYIFNSEQECCYTCKKEVLLNER